VLIIDYTPSAVLQFPYLKLHQFLYLRSGGRIGKRVGGAPTLLLTTTGRRTGELRTCALIYYQDGDRFVVAASKGGSDDPPFWLLNLVAHPDVRIQIGTRQLVARATVASAEERERLWPLVNRNNRGLAPLIHRGVLGRYDVYQRHTERVIPLVLLEPTTPDA